MEPNALDASSTSCGSNTSSWNAPVRPWKSHESGVEAGLRSALSQRAPGHGAAGSGCALSSAPADCAKSADSRAGGLDHGVQVAVDAGERER